MKNKSRKIKKEDWDAVESPPLSDDLLTRMKPVRESHPDIPSRVRGPQKRPVKIHVSIRLSPDIVEYFKSYGKGWQTKINKILHEYMNSNKSDTPP